MDPGVPNDVTLDTLPPEMLLMILKNLEKDDLLSISRVSRTLRNAVVEDPTFWKSVVLDSNKDSISKTKLISGYSHSLEHLTIESGDNFSDDLTSTELWTEEEQQKVLEMLRCFNGHTNLKSLQFSVPPSSQIIELISTSFPNLKELKIQDLDADYEIDGIRRLTKLKLLESLRIVVTEWERTSTSGLDLIADGFPCLRDFELIQYHATERAVTRILNAHKDTLKKFCFYSSKVTDSTYAKIAVCERLEELHIYGNEQLTDVSLTSMQTLPNLKRFYFSELEECQGMSSNGLISFFQNARNLTKVVLRSFQRDSSHFDDDVVVSITENLPELRHLKLIRCDNLSQLAFRAILENCGQLVSLELDRKLIRNDCVLEIPRKMPNLRKLVLLNEGRGYAKNGEVTMSGLIELGLIAPHLKISDDF